MASRSIITRRKATAKPASQARGVWRVSTRSPMWSVTEAKECPGARTGSSAGSMVSVARSRSGIGLALELGVGVAQARQISGARTGVQVGQQPVIARVRLEAGDTAGGIVQIAKDDGLRR